MADRNFLIQITLRAKDAATRQLRGLSGWLERNRAQFRALGIAAGAMGAAAVYGAKKAVDAANVQHLAEARLAAVMKNLQDATAEEIEELKKFAAAQQQVTTWGDEQILSGQAQLATFNLTTEQLKLLTPAMLDMASASEKATGQQVALEDIAKAMGRALDGGAGALTRYGVTIDDVTRKQFNQATRAERVLLLQKLLNSNYGGVAQSVAKTYAGRVRQLRNEFGDLMERIGNKLIPVMEVLVNAIRTYVVPMLSNWMDKTEGVGKTAENVGRFFKVFGNIVLSVGTAFKVVGQAIGDFAAMIVAVVSGQWKLIPKLARTMKTEWQSSIESVKQSFNRFNQLSFETVAKTEQAITDEKAKHINLRNQQLQEALAAEQEQQAQRAENSKMLQQQVTDWIIQKNHEQTEAIREADEKRMLMAEHYAEVITGAAQKIGEVENLTWKSGTKAFKEYLKQQLKAYVLQKTQELIATKITALAKAIANSTLTWGAAAWQIGSIIATFGGAIASLQAIKSFDQGGVVPGPPGKPVLVQALGGERFLGRQSIGMGNVYVSVHAGTIVGDRGINQFADIVGDSIVRKLKLERNI